MKNNQFTNILMGLTAFSAVLSIILCVLTISNSRQIRSMQVQMAHINQSRAVATSLVNELRAYSKKNPAVEPILQSIMPKAAAAHPASK